ncbi:DNA repair protein RadC [uncultured Anaerococcus sp.]|uniref:RadC family protein n=1 Tax=uncultured Anaerococcus sp. TaxID=293428 RepID=UPI0026188BA8|nr:DNA repair protein RadC [uncultured Anaerococcus sp.]
METKTIKDLDISDRPREKMINEGYEALNEEELLAVILSTGYKNKNVIELSKEILASFSYEELLEVEVDELIKIDGIKLAKATKIVASLQLGRRISEKVIKKKIKKITSSADVYTYMKNELTFKKKEHFVAILLDTKNVIIAEETISIGDLSSTIVNPREVFKPAIKKSAKSIVLVHNHPSGNPTPSMEDLQITKRLVDAGEILDISVLDHIIIGKDKFYSFKKEGNI